MNDPQNKDGRDTVLTRIRVSLKRDALDAERDADTISALDNRIRQAPQHPQPTLDMGVIERFIDRVQKHGGSVATLASMEELPQVVAAYIREKNLEARMVIAPPLKPLPWPESGADKIDYHCGVAQRGTPLAVSLAMLGIAETGAVLLSAGPDSPTTHNFVVEHHIVILRRDRIVAYLEEGWAHLHERRQNMPRVVNLITGPSRTGDIEQTIELGAHGPRRLHVLLLD